MSKKKLLFAVNAENNPYDITNQLEFRIERDLDTNKVTMTLDGQEVSSEELHSLENIIAIPSDVMEVLKDGGVTANPETTGEEESLGGLKIGNDKFKVVTPTQVADYVDAAIAEAIASVYKFKGSVPTYNDLPDEDLTVGDVYNVEDTGKNYAWDGEAWDTLGGELIDEHIADKNNPHEVTKAQVGLGNVDNTSDAAKKTAFTGSIASENAGFVTGGDVYTALGNKQATLVSGTNIKTVNGESILGSGNIAVVSGVNDGTNWTSITIGSTTKAIPAGGGGGGTTVVANPAGEATATLTKIQIGNVIYEITGGGSYEDADNMEF